MTLGVVSCIVVLVNATLVATSSERLFPCGMLLLGMPGGAMYSNYVFGPYATEAEAATAVEALPSAPELEDYYWIRVVAVKSPEKLQEWWKVTSALFLLIF